MSVYNGFSILEGEKKSVFGQKRRNEGRFPCVLRAIVKEVFFWAIVEGLGFGFWDGGK